MNRGLECYEKRFLSMSHFCWITMEESETMNGEHALLNRLSLQQIAYELWNENS